MIYSVNKHEMWVHVNVHVPVYVYLYVYVHVTVCIYVHVFGGMLHAICEKFIHIKTKHAI